MEEIKRYDLLIEEGYDADTGEIAPDSIYDKYKTWVCYEDIKDRLITWHPVSEGLPEKLIYKHVKFKNKRYPDLIFLGHGYFDGELWCGYTLPVDSSDIPGKWVINKDETDISVIAWADRIAPWEG